MFPLCTYKSTLLTSKPKTYHHLPAEGNNLLQDDKPEKTTLPQQNLISNHEKHEQLYIILVKCKMYNHSLRLAVILLVLGLITVSDS